MPINDNPFSEQISRRAVLGSVAAVVTTPALAQVCPIGPPTHEKGPRVWMDMDQIELDAAYDQSAYAPLFRQTLKRFASSSDDVRARLGMPRRLAYGPTSVEALDLYPAKKPNSPIFVFIHGGAWRVEEAKGYGYAAELFVNAGVNYIALDFTTVGAANGDISVMADQVRRGIAWTYKNAESFGADASRLYIGGHSSGGHLCGVALVTDWQKDFGLPADTVKGGLCMSGLYEMTPVRLSWRRTYVNFTDAMADAMSAQRHLEKLHPPIMVTYGTLETPDFQRQGRDFAAAVKAAGKPVQVIEAANYHHLEMAESLGNPYGPNGRAALALMKLTPA